MNLSLFQMKFHYIPGSLFTNQLASDIGFTIYFKFSKFKFVYLFVF